MSRIVARASDSRSVRSAGGGNGIPYARCSGTSEPEPRPRISRPPEMTSMTVAIFAATGGGR